MEKSLENTILKIQSPLTHLKGGNFEYEPNHYLALLGVELLNSVICLGSYVPEM